MEKARTASVLFAHRASAPDFRNLANEEPRLRRFYSDDQPVESLTGLSQTPPAAVAAVIDAGMAQPLLVAHRVRQGSPRAQLIFVHDDGEGKALQAAMRTTPLINAHWVMLSRAHPRLLEQIHTQVEIGERRLRHRTTLNRINLHLQSRAGVDPKLLNRLVASERYLTAIVKHSPDPILTLAISGEVLTWNVSAEQLWGWRETEALGRNLRDFFAPESQDESRRCLEKVSQTREHTRQEFIAEKSDGSRIPVELTIAPVVDEHGGLIAFSIIARDITQRKTAENLAREHRATLERVVAERTAQLQETVAQLEQFSSTVSHDLRAPIRTMQGYAQILHDEFTEADPQARHYTERIVNAAQRMDGLIDDVLSYSRITTAKLVKGPTDTHAIVADIIAQLPEQTRREATVIVEGTLPPVVAHRPLLEQALSNLIGNALKFVAPGAKPHVRIWAETAGENLKVFVADRGIGITPEFRTRVFGMFERGVPGTQYHGTGIGLAIVKKSIERLGGKVGFESKLGEGSVFWLELPKA